jgi:hypothetical protein
VLALQPKFVCSNAMPSFRGNIVVRFSDLELEIIAQVFEDRGGQGHFTFIELADELEPHANDRRHAVSWAVSLGTKIRKSVDDAEDRRLPFKRAGYKRVPIRKNGGKLAYKAN